MRTIHTELITLEPQVAAHAEEMFAVLSDPAIYAYENTPPASVDRLRARFEKLESRRSDDGSEQWLNWVIRIPTSELIGYVQATVHTDNSAGIAYELSSRHWGRGLGAHATLTMIGELVATYKVTRFFAVAKAANIRSIGMLERLGFAFAALELHEVHGVEPDEVLLSRTEPEARARPSMANIAHATPLSEIEQTVSNRPETIRTSGGQDDAAECMSLFGQRETNE